MISITLLEHHHHLAATILGQERYLPHRQSTGGGTIAILPEAADPIHPDFGDLELTWGEAIGQGIQ